MPNLKYVDYSNDGLKLCRKEMVYKSVSEFNRHTGTIDGLRSQCRQCDSESNKKYREENADRLAKNLSDWREKNPNNRKEHYQKNKERVYLQTKEYREARPEQYNTYWHNRQAKIRNNGGTHTTEEWIALRESYGNRCIFPGCDFIHLITDGKGLTRDHVIPVSLGGSSDISNIQPLCGPHNSAKHNRTSDFRLGY